VNVCRECARPIRWAKTPNGVPMPLDRDPVETGNILLTGTLAVKVSVHDLPIEGDAYSCHLDTCTRKRTPLALVADRTPRCTVCRLPMDPELAQAGDDRHPCC